MRSAYFAPCFDPVFDLFHCVQERAKHRNGEKYGQVPRYGKLLKVLAR